MSYFWITQPKNMKKTTNHIMYHAKKVLHHSGRLANKHKHILLGYMHICLVIISLGIYHMATSMYAQEN
ncbi:TPA: hypothetical protein DIC40_05700 [Patescibacteria group bacterium]|nr:hypothetical protein [Candidatus Gracilibacteria bacterium]